MFFRPLLQAWLKKAATGALRDAVLSAAEQKRNSAPGTVTPEAIRPCHLGFVFALDIESGCFEDLLDGIVTVRAGGMVVREGGLRGRRVAIILAGPGSTNARRATQLLIDGHRPERVISAGFAGALSPALKRDDILLADRLKREGNDDLTLDLPSGLSAYLSQSGVHSSPLLTVDHIIRLPREKRGLFERYAAMAVDMESFAVASVCRQCGVPFSSIRVVSDTSTETLPPDIEFLLSQKSTTARAGAAVGAILRRPASAKDLYQLRENALVSSGRLAKFLVGCDFT